MRPELPEPGVDFFQRLGLIGVAAIPLVPRPTFGGPTDYLAPMVVAFVAYCAFVYSAADSHASLEVFRSSLAALSFVSLSLYVGRVMWVGEASEYELMLSRVLLVLLVVTVTVLLSERGYERVLPWFFGSVVALAALVLVIGATGLTFLEPPLPARTLGITFPWHKTAGVPRSFGEQGIFVTMALAYLLTYRHRLSKTTLGLLSMSVLVITAMGQSRNIYVGVTGVLLAWFVLVVRHHWRIAPLVLLIAFVSTAVVERLMPIAAATPIGSAAIGTGIYERNVEARFSLFDQAVALIRSEPLRFFLGWPHSAWTSLTGAETNLHNHLLATLLFMGAIAGGFMLWAFFISPLVTIVARTAVTTDNDLALRGQFVVLCAVGALISINFYEGFFSAGLGFFVALAWSTKFALERERDQSRGSRVAQMRG